MSVTGQEAPIRLAFCLAHARRKFVAVFKTTRSSVARDVIARIGDVYAIEARIRGRSAEARRTARQAETKPILEALKEHLMTVLSEISGQSTLAKAIRYTLGHWDGLVAFLDDGRIDVDTNPVERSMRPIGLGRKNALFAGSSGGGRSWAILASLVAYFSESVAAGFVQPPTHLVKSAADPMGPVRGRRRDPSFSPYAGIACRAKGHDDDAGSAAFWSAARTRRMDLPVSSMRSAR